jgi:hypothetical protein
LWNGGHGETREYSTPGGGKTLPLINADATDQKGIAKIAMIAKIAEIEKQNPANDEHR